MPLLAFLLNDNQPHIVTLYLATLYPELLEDERFNPLQDTTGYISLQQDTFPDFLQILETQSSLLEGASSEVQRMFARLEDERVMHFRLHPEWFPRTRHQYYYQVHDPLTQPVVSDFMTILTCGVDYSVPYANLSVRVARFPLDALNDPAFNPLDHAIGQINLDQHGLNELAGYLQAAWSLNENSR